jgi:GNAT superfamily N-acetyltransferase
MTIKTSHLDELRDLLDRRAPGVIVQWSRDRTFTGALYIKLISVPASQRGHGLGQRVLDLICQTADARGWTLTLIPSGELGSDYRRLVNWYFAAGFAPTDGPQMKRSAREPAYA